MQPYCHTCVMDALCLFPFITVHTAVHLLLPPPSPLHSIPCAMPKNSSKEPGHQFRFDPLAGRSGRPIAESRQDPAEIAYTVGSSQSTHLPAHIAPYSSHFEGGSTLQRHESLPPMRSGENEIVDSRQRGAPLMPVSNRGTPWPPQPFPAPQPYDDQIASGTLGGTTSLFHGASNFRTRDFNIHVGDKSIDHGTSTD
jgi:hypothetical protein